MNVRILDEAEAEALEAAYWYDDQQLGLGSEFLKAVENERDAIAEDPKQFPLAGIPRSSREIRFRLLKRFSYVLYYEVKNAEALIVAVAHTSRRPFYWRRRK